MDTINIVKQIAQILASLTIVSTAIIAVYAWKNEYIGKKNIELAEEILALFYEARDAIAYIRNPIGYVGESKNRKASSNETELESHVYDFEYVIKERFNKNMPLFNKVYAMRYKYMARFGSDRGKPFEKLQNIVLDIDLAVKLYIKAWKEYLASNSKNDKEYKKHLEEMKKYEYVFWYMPYQKDDITPRVEAVIKEIETQALKTIKK